MNNFKVARRITFVILAMAAIGTLARAFVYEPYVVAKYRVAHFNAPHAKSGECRISTDKVQYKMLRTPSGIKFNLKLCFVAIFWGKEQEFLIPYKNTSGRVWGTSKYSTEAQEYADDYFQYRFKLSSADIAEIENEYSSKKWFEIVYTIGYLLVGLVMFWTCFWTIGRIARRFRGIPQGQD